MTFNCMGPDATFAAAAALVVQHLVEVFYFGLHTLFFCSILCLFVAQTQNAARRAPNSNSLSLQLARLFILSHTRKRIPPPHIMQSFLPARCKIVETASSRFFNITSLSLSFIYNLPALIHVSLNFMYLRFFSLSHMFTLSLTESQIYFY